MLQISKRIAYGKWGYPRGKTIDQIMPTHASSTEFTESSCQDAEPAFDDYPTPIQIKRIERAKQEWEVTVDLLPQLIFVLDRQMRILRANRTVEQWQLGEVIKVHNREVHNFLHKGCADPACYLAAFINKAQEQLQQSQPIQDEANDLILNRFLQLQIKPISPLTAEERRDADSFAILVLNDITEQKRAEAILHQQTLELKAHNEELNAFAHTVAHNLKGPLLPIIGHAQLLRDLFDTFPPETILQDLETIARNGEKISRIIEELLLLAGVRNMKVELEPLDMGAIVAEAKQRLAYLIDEHQVQFIVPDTWPVALGYSPWIEEVWANYIGNGIKYGGAPPRLELGATVSDSLVHFWIHDNGPGLTADEQARLFTPFTQLSQVRANGHGLGLSIVRRILHKLGGKVGVESEGIAGKGSTFSFSLPLA